MQSKSDVKANYENLHSSMDRLEIVSVGCTSAGAVSFTFQYG